jgi:PAS domain S-box-containing protein
VLEASGNVALGIVTVRDISDRKLAEDALSRERDNLLNVLEAMPDGVYIVDQEHSIQYVNSALKRIFGPVGGRKCYEYFHERSDACPWCKNAEVFAGKSVRWEWRSPRTGRTLDRIASPLRNPNGTISKLEIFHDITDRKQAEERLQHLQAELAYVDRLKIMGEMATGLAHELNQPLTAILMQAELAGRKLDLGRKLDTEELKKTWGQIADQAYRAGQIIRRMREFVRKNDPVQTPLDFGVLIEELLSLLRSDLRDHGIEIAIDLASPLPKITADKIQVQQVLLNLARNAIEAMADTPVEQRALGIAAKVRDRVLEISVSDTGCGIPAGDSDKLFSAFHSTKSLGMGLGLAISRSIVERHGGHIWAEPNSDRGSIFMLTLPIAGVAQEVQDG